MICAYRDTHFPPTLDLHRTTSWLNPPMNRFQGEMFRFHVRQCQRDWLSDVI